MEDKKIIITTAFRFKQTPYPFSKKSVSVPGDVARFALEAGLAREPQQNKATKPTDTKAGKE